MFVEIQDATFASAININRFDAITIRRTSNGYALSAFNLPIEDDPYYDIAVFLNEQQALSAFNSLMTAIENNASYWKAG